MKLYIWTDYCSDYSRGMAFAIAESEEEAKKLIMASQADDGSDAVWTEESINWSGWGNLEVRNLDEKVGRQTKGGS